MSLLEAPDKEPLDVKFVAQVVDMVCSGKGNHSPLKTWKQPKAKPVKLFFHDVKTGMHKAVMAHGYEEHLPGIGWSFCNLCADKKTMEKAPFPCPTCGTVELHTGVKCFICLGKEEDKVVPPDAITCSCSDGKTKRCPVHEVVFSDLGALHLGVKKDGTQVSHKKGKGWEGECWICDELAYAGKEEAARLYVHTEKCPVHGIDFGVWHSKGWEGECWICSGKEEKKCGEDLPF
jgi:hypothetical protein